MTSFGVPKRISTSWKFVHRWDTSSRTLTQVSTAHHRSETSHINVCRDVVQKLTNLPLCTCSLQPEAT